MKCEKKCDSGGNGIWIRPEADQVLAVRARRRSEWENVILVLAVRSLVEEENFDAVAEDEVGK